VLGLVQVPEHGGAILSTRSAERTVRGDGDGVDVTGVASVVGLNAAGSEFPDLNYSYQQLIACAAHSIRHLEMHGSRGLSVRW